MSYMCAMHFGEVSQEDPDFRFMRSGQRFMRESAFNVR